jgi:hypothetical protein
MLAHPGAPESRTRSRASAGRRSPRRAEPVLPRCGTRFGTFGPGGVLRQLPTMAVVAPVGSPVRKRSDADRAGDVREGDVAAPSTVVRRRAGGWIILASGVLLLLLSALSVGLPPVPEDDGTACDDTAALILALRPPTATSPTCRDLAVADTVLGGAMAALGVAMIIWWWLRRRSSD